MIKKKEEQKTESTFWISRCAQIICSDYKLTSYYTHCVKKKTPTKPHHDNYSLWISNVKATTFIINFSPRDIQTLQSVICSLSIPRKCHGLEGSHRFCRCFFSNHLHTELMAVDSFLLDSADTEPRVMPQPGGLSQSAQVFQQKPVHSLDTTVPSISNLMDVIHCCYPMSLQNIQEINPACCNQ